MSTYPTAENALLALVRAFNTAIVLNDQSTAVAFSSANSSADDWLVLDAAGPVAAVVEMVGASLEGDNLDGRGAHGMVQEKHAIGVWLCVARGVGVNGDGQAKANIKTLTEAFKDYLRPLDRLSVGAPVSRAMIVKTSEPSYISPTNNIEAATHVAQLVTLTVYCESDAPEPNEGGY